MKRNLRYSIILLLIPLSLVLGILLWDNRNYSVLSMMIAFLACIPFFLTFEKKAQNSRKLILIAVMIALSVAGRLVFAALPGFKPVTAVVVITALYFGAEAGFLTGSLSALLSNIFYGQGPWTPFQMFTWGLLGFLAGILARTLLKSRPLMLIYGALAGVVFSLMMDIWTVLSFDTSFALDRYLVVVGASLPFMAIYAASNVVFLLLLAKPIGAKLERIKLKYGL
ncbi:MAG: ECF transporter S component [Christensenellales bacterium]|jgi:energy-coupling factor transport system substrate-specific component